MESASRKTMPEQILHSYYNVINYLVTKDEVELALKVADSVPGYFRDNPVKEIVDLKNEIMSRIATATDYAKIDRESPEHPSHQDIENYGATLRAQLILKELESLDKPLIFDFAGGGRLLQEFLMQRADKPFVYFESCLTKKDRPASSRIKIFVACEIIEHLWNPQDLRTEMLAGIGLADIIHLSTPKYEFDEISESWGHRSLLGHLRTYTPREFVAAAQKVFPEYDFTLYDSKVMHLRGVHRNAPEHITRSLNF